MAMDYRDRIIELRKESGLSQAQLANKLNISQSAAAIISLSKIFNKTTDYILGLEDEWGNVSNNNIK